MADGLSLGKLKKAKVEEKILTYLQEKQPSEVLDSFLMVGLAILGLRAFKTPEGILFGPVALKLAQALLEALALFVS